MREALVNALLQQRENLEEAYDERLDLESIVRDYLSIDHMLGRENGCPSAALLPEIGRQPEMTRAAYEDELSKFTEVLSSIVRLRS